MPLNQWTDPLIAIDKRTMLLHKAKWDVRYQALLYAIAKKDLIFWVNYFVWTYDPRQERKILPLMLFPKQQQYLEWRSRLRQDGLNGLLEKSRDSGATWLNVCHQVHCWLFEDNFKGAFGSRKEDIVDRIGDPDSIFEKIRILLRNLPTWMLPEKFDWQSHDTFKKLINPDNGSTITGEAGDNLGRGGRSSMYDWDEVAFAERPERIEAALSGNSDVIFYTSTVNGHNFFYKKRSQLPDECVFRIHWKEDPRKDIDWYRDQCSKFDKVIIASEIDIDYGASIEGIYISNEWVMKAIAREIPTNGKRYAALDVAASGKNFNVFMVREGNKVIAVESWQGLDTTQTSFKVVELMNQYKATHLNFDSDGVGAGVAGTLGSIPDLKFRYSPLHGGDRPSNRWWQGEGRTSREKFHNARAEYWGILQLLFKNTYDYDLGSKDITEDELISIPNHATLIQQISQPIGKKTATGKVIIESKDDMRKRGLQSPDYGDCLAYLFAPRINDYDVSAIATSGVKRSSSRVSYGN